MAGHKVTEKGYTGVRTGDRDDTTDQAWDGGGVAQFLEVDTRNDIKKKTPTPLPDLRRRQIDPKVYAPAKLKEGDDPLMATVIMGVAAFTLSLVLALGLLALLGLL